MYVVEKTIDFHIAKSFIKYISYNFFSRCKYLSYISKTYKERSMGIFRKLKFSYTNNW